MLQGSCPSRTAPFFTLPIPADINSLWLLSALELLNLEVAYRKKEEQPHGCPSPKTFFVILKPNSIRLLCDVLRPQSSLWSFLQGMLLHSCIASFCFR